MGKRYPTLVLILALCLVQLPKVLAAEGKPSFSDVPAGSWFEQGVFTCAGKGVMIGTAEGVFSPEEKLSNAQCLTLALRIYDLQRGGTGELEKAPEDWGLITMTLADGTVVKGQGQGRPFGYSSFKRDGNADAHLYFYLEPDQVEWGKSVDAQTATVTLDGETCRGVAQCWEPAKDGNWVISFYQMEGDIWVGDYYRAPHPDVTEWYRDTAYTAEKWGLDDQETYPGFWELGRDLGFDRVGVDETCRYQFASALAEAAGELPRLYEVKELPDLEWDNTYTATGAIFGLYEAGVLTGSDEYGSFGYFDHLTRAQAAVMVARVLDESQRAQTPPKAMPYLNYTLTQVDLGEWEHLYGYQGVAADWLPVSRQGEEGIYRVDGTVFPLEEGLLYFGEGPVTSGPRRYVTLRIFQDEDERYGIFDVTAGEIALPLGSYEDYEAWWDAHPGEPEPEDIPYEKLGFPYGTGDMPISAWNRILCLCGKGRYYNYDVVPVTEKFDWVGPLNKDGAGFVGKEGKTYRIQFEV